jgi:hypothetical protein
MESSSSLYVGTVFNTSYIVKYFAQNSWPSIVRIESFQAHGLILSTGSCLADLCWRHTHPQQGQSLVGGIDVRRFQVT